MRPLTAWLEDGYCSITVATHQLITAIIFVSKNYTRLWKGFANRLYLVLHANDILFLKNMCEIYQTRPRMLNPAAFSNSLCKTRPAFFCFQQDQTTALPPTFCPGFASTSTQITVSFSFSATHNKFYITTTTSWDKYSWLKTEIPINRSLYLGIYNLHNTMSRFSVNMYPTWQNPWHYHEQAKILHLCQSRKQISS